MIQIQENKFNQSQLFTQSSACIKVNYFKNIAFQKRINNILFSFVYCYSLIIISVVGNKYLVSQEVSNLNQKKNNGLGEENIVLKNKKKIMLMVDTNDPDKKNLIFIEQLEIIIINNIDILFGIYLLFVLYILKSNILCKMNKNCFKNSSVSQTEGPVKKIF
ncbi:transmembrane protein, putative (macronuclear) [Tetrahymena thermophila SB210]|uniref:Transmembrane protein, putative n=1 Tax=Tetrahymena thermophila (strain SB210) TaxID=312017 RepID=W7XBN7_TETTS|nr:transmembrane protein, putative [Tetrahymena thermophila SB210]EWS73808.1 transmembrane protein, putative [Tetrahymena thermophila SB210]|eukprot:XP_012653688.1 transmembrane protein, putative [Tetrahymena thermophila SB210]